MHICDPDLESIKNRLATQLSRNSIGYCRKNYHTDPSELLHITLLAIQANTCIIQHKSSAIGKQYYIAQEGELNIETCNERVMLTNRSKKFFINEKTGVSCIDRRDWRRLENSSNSIVFYYEINIGPHQKGDTKWM